MNLFNKRPDFVRSSPGWEQLVWRRLPAILLWGTLLPLALAGVNHALAPVFEVGPTLIPRTQRDYVFGTSVEWVGPAACSGAGLSKGLA